MITNQQIKNLLPDFLTSINIMLGLSSVILVMQAFHNQTTIPSSFVTAGWMIVVACIVDGLDGKCARWVGKKDQFGVHFDSFADLIVFGFAPSVLLYAAFFKDFGFVFVPVLVIYIVSSAYRLARFNCKTKGGKKSNFEGLPTTSAGGISASLVIFTEFLQQNTSTGINERVLVVVALCVVLLISLLMVSTIRFDTMYRFFFRGSHRIISILLLIGFIIIAYNYPAPALFFLGFFYVLESLIRWFIIAPVEPEQIPEESSSN